MRNSFIRGMRIAAGICAVALALSGCGAKTKSAGTSAAVSTSVPDTITAQVAYTSRDFSPSTTSSALSLAANWHVVEPLYGLDYSHNFTVVPMLAQGEPTKVSDTEYTVTLRSGAKFSNGQPVTPEDVVSSFKRTTMDGSLYKPMLNFIAEVSPKGNNQVTFKFNQPFPLFKQRLAVLQIVPSNISDDDLKKQPTGSGPWKYASITDNQVKFDKNDLYNGPFPAQTKHMVWNMNTDDTARITAMAGGKTDVMELVPPNAFATLQRNSELKTVQSFNQAFVLFNTKAKPFDNVKVRQAVLYAIDVNKLIANQMQGQAEAATSFLPKEFNHYHRAKNVYTKNVAKAKELLKEAGITGTHKLTLYTTDHSWITNLTPQIKNDLKEIGFDVALQSLATSALFPNVIEKDNSGFQMAIAPGDPSVFGNDPDLLINWWFGDNGWTKTRSRWHDSAGYNQLHKLLDQALAAPSDAQRQQLWNQAYDLLSEEVSIYPLFFRKTTTAIKKGVFKNFGAVGVTGINLLNSKLSR